MQHGGWMADEHHVLQVLLPQEQEKILGMGSSALCQFHFGAADGTRQAQSAASKAEVIPTWAQKSGVLFSSRSHSSHLAELELRHCCVMDSELLCPHAAAQPRCVLGEFESNHI